MGLKSGIGIRIWVSGGFQDRISTDSAENFRDVLYRCQVTSAPCIIGRETQQEMSMKTEYHESKDSQEFKENVSQSHTFIKK